MRIVLGLRAIHHGAGYRFYTEFQTAYLEKGVECFVDFMDEVPTASQIKKDASALYSALLNDHHGGIGRRCTMPPIRPVEVS